MGLLDDDDLEQMTNDLAEIVSDRPASVVFRRGSLTLDAQTVRVARLGSAASKASGQASQETRGRVLISGAVDMNVQVDDRCTIGGVMYQVVFVRPNRDAATMAEAEQVE
jgi:hypothetical protein